MPLTGNAVTGLGFKQLQVAASLRRELSSPKPDVLDSSTLGEAAFEQMPWQQARIPTPWQLTTTADLFSSQFEWKPADGRAGRVFDELCWHARWPEREDLVEPGERAERAEQAAWLRVPGLRLREVHVDAQLPWLLVFEYDGPCPDFPHVLAVRPISLLTTFVRAERDVDRFAIRWSLHALMEICFAVLCCQFHHRPFNPRLEGGNVSHILGLNISGFRGGQ